ncbi:uncharacterized protein LOC119082696 isoform X2 [Bradysia coprophila]|uniref:uncharacterized protein LOC119082696 isoform X2 n=1 Tax=Bradysia coprophila TaxID=38358 RepID=UPI00187DD477|nr:uncharacterized protein LOC119082696 isoform X2 [Bradysia coprophila]
MLLRFGLCCLYASCILVNAVKAGNQTGSDSVQKIFDFLDECSKNFILGEQKDVVVVLGNTGSGKSTLTFLLTGVKLIAVETDEGSGEYVIVDENKLISPPDKSTQSQTIIPNLRIDRVDHTSYYDSAGFEDSRGVEHDLSVTYLIQKLLKFANSVKFVFAIAYSSVRIGGDRHDFKKLARHATALIRNIDKYRDSMALVVTKVETKVSNGQIVTDAKTIELIGKFLEQTKSDLNSEDPSIKAKMAKFIDILLQKQDNKLSRIQIVRAPTEEGIFNEMTLPKQERQAIRTMLKKRLKYTRKQDDDFGYSISDESKLKVHSLFEKLEHNLMNDVVNIGNDIRKVFAQQATRTPDKRARITRLITGIEQLSKVNSDDIELFKQQLASAVSILQLNIQGETLNALDRHIGFAHYFTSVSSGKLSRAFRITEGLKSVKESLSKTKDKYKLELVAEVKAQLARDVLNINNQIKSFYFKKEAEMSDVNTLSQFMLSQFKTLSTVASKEPTVFNSQLIAAINSLRIHISSDTLKLLSDHIEVVKFVESLNNAASSVKIEIQNGLAVSIKHLSDSKNWYQFTINFQNELSQYRVQQNPAGFNPVALDEIINRLIAQTEKGNSEVLFKDTGIKGFVDRINGRLVAGFENIKINSNKLKSIKRLWQRNMLTAITPLCTAAELVVKGYNIKMSEVVNVQCQAATTKIMAVNKIFIDANINKVGHHQLQIIAPTWEVVGQRVFELNGRNGANFDGSPAGVASGVAGPPGQAGKPGSQGGHFFGIGNTFINGQTLRVISNGGTGGNGGDGRDGQWKKSHINKLWGDRFITTVNATPSGAGGDGGCGGLGGLPGSLAIIGLKGASNVALIANAGQGGAPGHGGTSKETSDIGLYRKNGGEIKYSIQPNHFRPPSGRDGANCASRQSPGGSPVAPRPPFVNHFKAYARENLGNNVFELSLRQFIQDVENNRDVQSAYDILSFTNEMLDLENQFWNLRNKIAFRPFYESILNRLTVYEKTLPATDARRRVLNYLYAAALSQINSNIVSQKTILNLRDYLNEAQTHINDIRVTGREIQIRNHQVEYTNTMLNKMNAAKDLMNQKIFPQLDKDLELIEANFVVLVDETVEKKRQTHNQIDEYKRKLREMKKSLSRGRIFGGLKVVRAAMSFFGPVGAGIGAVIGAGTSIAEAAVGKQIGPSTIAQVSSSLDSVLKAFKYNNELFKQQLNDIENEIGSNEKFNDLRGQLQKIKSDVDKADKDESFLPIFNARKQLQELLKNEKQLIQKEHPHDITLNEIVSKVQDIGSVVGMSIEMYNQIKGSKERMREVADVIQSLERELVALDLYEAQIYDTMIPMFRATQAYLKSQSASGGSHVQLDIKKWEIKNRLGDVKYMFGQMTAVSGTHDDFQHYFEKVLASMDVLIDVYDRIESISDHTQFVDFITKITSNGQGITTDPQLMNIINRMDEMIQTNLVLERHEFIVNAFKQHYFPFAPLFLDKFDLPPRLRFNDTEALKANAIKQIRDLNSGVIISQATLGSKDISLFDDVSFDSNASISLLPPFYVWRHNEFKDEIRKLFKGESILIKADVNTGVNKNAIKFNRIGIQFKSPNATVQAQLNNAMQDFDLTMAMVGNSYYRCGNRVYHLQSDGNVVIEQSMKRDSKENPIKQNNVYRKISESNYFLSPYGLWNMKLESEKIGVDLKKFENEVFDIELVGRGQYLKNTDAVSRDICNGHLDRYYSRDLLNGS